MITIARTRRPQGTLVTLVGTIDESFNNVSIASWVLRGVYVPDIITVLASLYFILGDIDR